MSIINEIVDLNEEKVIEILKDRLAKKEDPMKIMDDVKIAMKKVGELFSSGEFFLPDLMMSGENLRQIFEVIAPLLQEGDNWPPGRPSTAISSASSATARCLTRWPANTSPSSS